MVWKKVDKDIMRMDIGFDVLDYSDCRENCNKFPDKCIKDCSCIPTKIKVLEVWEDDK